MTISFIVFSDFFLSNISLLILTVIGLISLVVYFSGPESVGTGEDQVLKSIMGPEYPIYKWSGSREPELLNV